MNGARTLLHTLVKSGIDTCFMNPGTSEMHFVKSLDDVSEMKSVLGLFEGAVTGAADGYGRMSQKPAATLLHLGPGLANGIANLHNAKRAYTPVVNIVGDHATYHHGFDAPLESDIEGLALPVSSWFRSVKSSETLAIDAAECVAASYGPPAGVATLLLPADLSWGESTGPVEPAIKTKLNTVDDSTIEEIGNIIKGEESVAFLLGGKTLLERGLTSAAQVCQQFNVKLLAETFPARLERGASIPKVERLGYLAEFIESQLANVKHLILIDTKAPVSFFAYPNKPSYLVPEGATVHTLASNIDDSVRALDDLARYLGVENNKVETPSIGFNELIDGPLKADNLANVVGMLLPEGAVVSDESNTAGIFLNGATQGCPPHDWLCLTGGSIGQGLPLATGAALGAKNRRIISLEADGSALYTIQALWTQARESLDVTTVILDNRRYAVLKMELDRVGADAPGDIASSMLDISKPDIDFVSISKGLGVPAVRVDTVQSFHDEFKKSINTPGPSLIHAILPEGMGF